MSLPTINLPVQLYRAEHVRELDRVAIEDIGIGGYTLMTRAGEAAYGALRARWPEARRITIVSGVGNNAGDGYVVGRLACRDGLATTVSQIGDATRLKGDALMAAQEAEQAGVTTQSYAGAAAFEADVVVDAVFGTGLDREVAGEWRRAIEAINAAACPVLSIDIPSGLAADTGAVLGVAVGASVTVTFIGLKQGLFTAEGPERCGEVLYHDLDVPDEVYGAVDASAVFVDFEGLKHWLAPRSRTANKGHFGHVLVVGGDEGYAGAARMAGEAAARCGAGLVSVALRAGSQGVCSARPELMCRGIEEPADLEPLIERASVVAVGPGLGQLAWGRAMFGAALASGRPLVVDADGLNLLATQALRREDWVLTPHPGEAARLLNSSPREVQADRFAAVARLQEHYGGVVALKGPGTLVLGSEGTVGLCRLGNPGMAAGGMGDVLTGIIAALLAQGVPASEAARLGVWLHARAADLASNDGERGMLATDLLHHLRHLVNP